MHNISLFYKLFINFYLTTYKYSQTISSYLSIQMIIHFSNSFSFKKSSPTHFKNPSLKISLTYLQPIITLCHFKIFVANIPKQKKKTLSKYFLFHLSNTSSLPINFQNFLDDITANAWRQMSTSNLTNFYSHPRNFKLVPETKKRGRERREKFERRASITVHHGSRHDEMIKRTTFWSLHCYASDITISLWLMQTFVADSAAMYCPLPFPLIPSLLPPRSTRARCVVTSVFASAYVMITRVSGSVCNCSPFLPPKWRGGKERRGGYGT